MKNALTILFFIIALSLATESRSQINVDSIFKNAIDLSKKEQYDNAIEEAKKALSLSNERADIVIFIANVYSWQDKNDFALGYINIAKELNLKTDEFYETWSNILLRSKKFQELLTVCDEAEQEDYANKEDLLCKRLIAYTELKKYTDGIILIEKPENKKYLSSISIDNLYTNLLLKRNSNVLSAFYSLDMLSNNFAAQHFASLGYSFKLKEHTWAFRTNYANRFAKNDLQLETDFYLMLNNSRYMYLNYGYGINARLFPEHRLGVEYYFPLSNKFETSVGVRYLYFTGDNTSNVGIITSHIGKYFQKSFLSLRAFYVYKTPTPTSSVSLIGNYRIYKKNEIDYWGIGFGVGNSPDDIYSLSGGFNQLMAYKIKVERNFMLSRTSDFNIGLAYSREEYGTTLTQFRNRITIEAGYKLRIK